LNNNTNKITENTDKNNIKEDLIKEDIIKENMDKNNIRFVDLFCGIGGFHQALKRIGANCVFACDIDAKCRLTYEINYKIKPQGDITKIDVNDIPNFDILCSGFPCQPFSNSGKKKGFNDKRGGLFENIINIARIKNPSYMFLENVKHIKKINNGNIFKYILDRLNEIGYRVQTLELSPHQLGIPQKRERIIFICIRNDIYNKDIIFNIPNVNLNINQIFETDNDIIQKYRISKEDEEILIIWDEMIKYVEVGEKLSPTILCNEFQKNYTEEEFKNLAFWKQDYITKNKTIYNKYKNKWDEWLRINTQILTKKEIYGKLEWQVGKKKINDSIFNHFIQFRQSGIRVKTSEYFPTLVAIVQTPIYAKERRYITPRECARLQSFSEDFILYENDHIAYKQLGNAVNVDVIYFVIYNTLKTYNICD